MNVAITGVGVVSCIGLGTQSFWRNLCAGSVGLSQAPSDLAARCRPGPLLVGTVRVGTKEPGHRPAELAHMAALEALSQSTNMPKDIDRGMIAVGTGTGEIDSLSEFLSRPANHELMPPFVPFAVTTDLKTRLGCTIAPCTTFVNACAAGSSAIAHAASEIAAGQVEVALAGGVEVLSGMLVSGFQSLRALSSTQCRPFSRERNGTQLAEGAAFVVLESQRRAGHRALAWLTGFGISSDAYHPTRPDPAGGGAALAMSRALVTGRLAAKSVDYISAHGTATPANDRAELNAINALFGGRASSLPISSMKGQVGHTAAASGAMNLAACVLALQAQCLPPTVPFSDPDAEFDGWDFVPNRSRNARIDFTLSNSFGFGGSNVSLLTSRLPLE